jgi:hypothetical protein
MKSLPFIKVSVINFLIAFSLKSARLYECTASYTASRSALSELHTAWRMMTPPEDESNMHSDVHRMRDTARAPQLAQKIVPTRHAL